MEIIDTTETIAKDLIEAGYEVALNKKNTLGFKQFHCSGVGNSVPDMLFWNPNNQIIFDPKYIPRTLTSINSGFIETKPGQHIKEIIDGIDKTTRYFGYFISNKAEFSVDNKRIYNIDVFLLGTRWSRTGMIYKGDEEHHPIPLIYISERYNAQFHPYTHCTHSFIRARQKKKRRELRNQKYNILPNRINTQTGIMISKIPLKENEPITYEYWAWLGNKMIPLIASEDQDHLKHDSINTQARVLTQTANAVLIRTELGKELWIPRSQIHSEVTLLNGEKFQFDLSRWFYAKNKAKFGAT